MNPLGVVTGGWSWVVAVYAITWFALATYALSLFWRARRLPAAPPSPPRAPRDGSVP
jgi:hypothetical protein